jgi:hypothetical protein
MFVFLEIREKNMVAEEKYGRSLLLEIRIKKNLVAASEK